MLKIGGSLFDHSRALVKRIAEEELAADILIVPGGGDFADTIRKVYREKQLSDDAAHWMAVLAMNQYAYYLADGTGIPLADSLKGTGIRIALPYEILRKDDALPHSWDVTSDTIAAWMALKTGGRLIKATDVDGIFADGKLLETVEASRLCGTGETCIDSALPEFLLNNRLDAFVVNGLDTARVSKAVREEKTMGTRILGR
ncbi:amino acid kinase [Methanocella arvoryzae]|uniref:amino acid kinase n=1 Tax=Methanocella arvoryzae TaxID=1175445 RepID=UPI001E429382|nr:amino acid kinase [Methanocella arvoryzae]